MSYLVKRSKGLSVGPKTCALKLASGHTYVKAKGVSYGSNADVSCLENFKKIVLGEVLVFALRAQTMDRNKQRELY